MSKSAPDVRRMAVNPAASMLPDSSAKRQSTEFAAKANNAKLVIKTAFKMCLKFVPCHSLTTGAGQKSV